MDPKADPKASLLPTTPQRFASRCEATTLNSYNCQSSFIISLVILEEVSSILLPITRMLQTSSIDIFEVM